MVKNTIEAITSPTPPHVPNHNNLTRKHAFPIPNHLKGRKKGRLATWLQYTRRKVMGIHKKIITSNRYRIYCFTLAGLAFDWLAYECLVSLIRSLFFLCQWVLRIILQIKIGLRRSYFKENLSILENRLFPYKKLN